MSDETLPGTPGTGDTPEPEDPALREQIIEGDEQLKRDREADAGGRSRTYKSYYAGGAATGMDPEAPPPTRSGKAKDSDEKSPPPPHGS